MYTNEIHKRYYRYSGTNTNFAVNPALRSPTARFKVKEAELNPAQAAQMIEALQDYINHMEKYHGSTTQSADVRDIRTVQRELKGRSTLTEGEKQATLSL